MQNNSEKTSKAVLVATLGGLLILGLVPQQAQGFSWHWPFRRPHPIPVSITASEPVASTIHKLTEADLVTIAEPSVIASSSVPSAKSLRVPVLMYHHVGELSAEQRAKDPLASDLTVSPTDFESQVKYFHDRGYNSITVKQLYGALQTGAKLPSKPIIFTFDDGYKDVFDNAIRILHKYGYTGSFAIATELLGRPAYGTWDDVIAADKAGIEILSHTENHLDLTSPKYSEEDLVREIFGSKQILESKLEHPVDFFVYPYGHSNYHVGELLAQAGYKMAFTTNFGFWMDPTKELVEPRVRVHGTDGLEKLKKIFEPKPHNASVQTNP